MADSVVVYSLLQTLSQLLAQEAKLLLGVKDQVRSLEAELKLINRFLQNSNGKRDQLALVNKIRDVAYDVEDIIDTFITEEAKHRRRNKLGRFLRNFNPHHSFAKSIVGIKGKINEIYCKVKQYGITEAGGDAELKRSLRRRWKDVEEDDVVGFVNEAETVVNQLIGGKTQLDAISIIGMGGQGKTTLARKIYNDIQVKDHFNRRAWIYVSQEYRIRDLMISILKCVISISKEPHKMSENEMKETLFECLTDRRYLIVLDDVWTTDLWDEVKASFPDNNKGSRVIITTRLREVATHASPNHTHSLQLLDDTNSWELLSKKVFQGRNFPPELEDLKKKMVECCGGFPLSIVVLGGLLATEEKKYRTWFKMLEQVNSDPLNQDRPCDAILALSYDNLPCQLKSCFLYIGAFPKDFEIPARQLIQLWMAEGFLPNIDNRNMEDVAKDYLEELIDRSLIQVARRRADGGIKTCRIHAIVHDFCVAEAVRDEFLDVQKEVNPSSSSKPRRLSIHCSTPEYIWSNQCDFSRLRSLLCFGQDAFDLSIEYWKSLYEGFMLVRVLDLGSVVIDKVPHEIANLIHLRYLSMNAPSLKVIPHSLCDLLNLQTLDLRKSNVDCLPIGIWKMEQLRHLYLSRPMRLPLPRDTDDKSLSNLNILSIVASDKDTTHLMVKDKFPNVTKLGLRSYSEWSTWEFLKSLNHLNHLRTLKIMKNSKLPGSPDSFPLSLTKITLVETWLSSTEIKVLEKLPKLRILKLLEGSFRGLEIDCSAGGFPELDVLQMVKLDTAWWTLGEDAMQKLRRLVINECVQLTMLPDELWNLTTLREVEVLWPSSGLAMRLQQLEMNDRRNILIYPPPCHS